MPSVVTYSHAYRPGRTITLCASHAASPPDWAPSLGAVQRGQHRGRCDACDRPYRLTPAGLEATQPTDGKQAVATVVGSLALVVLGLALGLA